MNSAGHESISKHAFGFLRKPAQNAALPKTK
jgi:hypothetical protein